jgi:hypothetical protein
MFSRAFSAGCFHRPWKGSAGSGQSRSTQPCPWVFLMPDTHGSSRLVHEGFPPLPGFYQSPSSRRARRFLDACAPAPIPDACACSRHSALRIPLATGPAWTDRPHIHRNLDVSHRKGRPPLHVIDNFLHSGNRTVTYFRVLSLWTPFKRLTRSSYILDHLLPEAGVEGKKAPDKVVKSAS